MRRGSHEETGDQPKLITMTSVNGWNVPLGPLAINRKHDIVVRHSSALKAGVQRVRVSTSIQSAAHPATACIDPAKTKVTVTRQLFVPRDRTESRLKSAGIQRYRAGVARDAGDGTEGGGRQRERLIWLIPLRLSSLR